MKKSLQILFNGSTSDVSDYLPIQLERIKEISQTCKTSAEKVVTQFSVVMKTMDQVQQATLLKQGKTQEAKDKAKESLQLENNEKEYYDEIVEADKRNAEKLTKEVEARNEEYKKAYDESPGVGTMVGLALAETLTKVAPIIAIAGGGSMLLGAATGMETVAIGASAVGGLLGVKGINARTETVAEAVSEEPAAEAQAVNVSENDESLYRYAKKLEAEVGAGIERIWTETGGDEPINFKMAHGEDTDGLSLKDLKGKVSAYQDKIKDSLNGAEQNLYDKVKKYASSMQTMIENIRKVDRKSSTKKGDVDKLKEEYQKLSEKLQKLDTERCARSGANTLDKPGPGMMNKLMEMGKGVNLTENALKNAHLKVQCAREQQKSAEERLEKALIKSRESQRSKIDIENKLYKIDLQSKELPQLLNAIGEGLKVMGELKQEWSNLLRFFTSIANIIETAMGPPMRSFVDFSERTSMNRVQPGSHFTPSDMIKQQIYEIAKEAGKRAFVVNRISGCYSSISKKHLMPLVSQLGSMIALDKETDGRKITQFKQKLEAESRNARSAVEALTNENINRARKALQERMNELDTLQATCLTVLPVQEKLAIQNEAKQITQGMVISDPDIDLKDFDV